MKSRPFGGTGLRVSEIALRTATFGGGSGHDVDTDESAAIFNAHAEAGGNFLATTDI